MTVATVPSPMVTEVGLNADPVHEYDGSLPAKSPGWVASVSVNVHTDPVGIGLSGETAPAVVTSSVPELVGPSVSLHEYATGKTRALPPT